ncbi:MAG: transposase, partial [Candidatus Nitrotoga sp.]|nr:transposase [Candidatus Nitrotoga sp.]
INAARVGTPSGCENLYEAKTCPPNLTQKRPYWGNHFWAKGYCVDTVGLNGEMIQKYVRFQEKEEQHQEQLQLESDRAPSRKAR